MVPRSKKLLALKPRILRPERPVNLRVNGTAVRQAQGGERSRTAPRRAVSAPWVLANTAEMPDRSPVRPQRLQIRRHLGVWSLALIGNASAQEGVRGRQQGRLGLTAERLPRNPKYPSQTVL